MHKMNQQQLQILTLVLAANAVHLIQKSSPVLLATPAVVKIQKKPFVIAAYKVASARQQMNFLRLSIVLDQRPLMVVSDLLYVAYNKNY